MCQLHESSSAGAGSLSSAALSLVPSHPAAQEALALTKSSVPASIFNHSFRTYLYAQALANEPSAAAAEFTNSLTSVSVEPHVLFVACILHDLGVNEKYDDHSERFEVCGADEAVRLLKKHGESDTTVREAWLAMTLHTSPGIPEHLGGAVQSVRLAIRTEFGTYNAAKVPLSEKAKSIIRDELPRLEIEKDLRNAVVRQAMRNRYKAPESSWPGLLLRAKEENPEKEVF